MPGQLSSAESADRLTQPDIGETLYFVRGSLSHEMSEMLDYEKTGLAYLAVYDGTNSVFKTKVKVQSITRSGDINSNGKNEILFENTFS